MKEGVVADFLLTPRGQDDLFSFKYEGYVLIPQSSGYVFYTGSDDGSRLWIDDHQVVNNDGLHGLAEKSGSMALAKGYHKIRVAFFERTGNENLVVYVRSQYLPKQKLPREWLYH